MLEPVIIRKLQVFKRIADRIRCAKGKNILHT
jgi:hypothetical protein